MNAPRQIYLLDPKQLSPETIAVTFAKTSRSPESFREIAASLSDEQSAQFHEKWVVGYGHSSVAEHAVLHIAVENVSRLAVEVIESNRLASFTEKSTRYQMWDGNHYLVPPEFADAPVREQFEITVQKLFKTYEDSLEPVRQIVEKKYPRGAEENDSAYDRRIRSQYVDVCRFLLPAAALANLGVTINARALEHALQKMLSHPLEEVRAVGMEMKQAAQAEVPTLVKYAEPVAYLQQTQATLLKLAEKYHSRLGGRDWCRLVSYEPDGETRVLTAALYRYSGLSFEEAHETAVGMGAAGRKVLAEDLLGGMDEHDDPLRELEHITYTLDMVIDQGAFFELKRHRMMTQTPQMLNTRLGYAVPRMIVEAGMEQPYHEAMEAARQAYEALVLVHPQAASYVVPNGFNRRVLLTMNLRSAYHFCELRSAPNAHFSARRAALRVAEQIQRVHPAVAGAMRLPKGETWQGIEKENFTETAHLPS